VEDPDGRVGLEGGAVRFEEFTKPADDGELLG
jgi:hypothetical protein